MKPYLEAAYLSNQIADNKMEIDDLYRRIDHLEKLIEQIDKLHILPARIEEIRVNV